MLVPRVPCWNLRTGALRRALAGILLMALVGGHGAGGAWGQEAVNTVHYRAYTPDVERTFIANPETGRLQHSHAGTIVRWRGQFWAAWNGNTTASVEGKPGQKIYVARSEAGRTWTEPVSPFVRADRSETPVDDRSEWTQWQPVFHVVQDTLVCFWTQMRSGGKTVVYASRLGTPKGVWHHEVIATGLRGEDDTYYPFTTQDPTQLRSGRILLPLVWVSPERRDMPGVSLSYWRREKRVGALYSDDGRTWTPGYFATYEPWTPLLWEPMFVQARSGAVRVFVRRHPAPGRQEQLWLTGRVFPDSLVTGLNPTGVQVSTSRAGQTRQDGGARHIFYHNDSPPGRFVQDRRNLAVFVSRDNGRVLVPGTAFTEDESENTVGYPQGIQYDGALHVVYSEGEGPVGMKAARITPVPHPDTFYIYPREHTHLYETPAYDDGAYGFEGGPSLLQTEASTAAWTGSRMTFGSMVRLKGREGTILDTRPAQGGESGVAIFISPDPSEGVTFFHPKTGNVTTGIQPPLHEWVYLGVSVLPDSITFVIVPRNGPERVIRRSLDQPFTVRGDRVRIGAPIPISSLTDIEARMGDLLLRSDTVWTAERHLAQARRPRATLVTRSRMTGTGEASRTGGLYLDADAVPRRQAKENIISTSGQVRLRTRRPRGSATVTRHRGRRALQIQGAGSAGVELPAVAGTDGAPIRFSFRVWIDRCCGRQALATVGDADHHVVLRVRRKDGKAMLRLDRPGSDTWQELEPLPLGEWVDISMSIEEGTVMVEVEARSFSVATKSRASRFLLGEGFVNRTKDASMSNPAGHLFVDLESFRGSSRSFPRSPSN